MTGTAGERGPFHPTATSLPTFSELAANQIAAAGKRDKTIFIKVAINTARMMVAHESYMHESNADLLKAANNALTPLRWAAEHIAPMFKAKVLANIAAIEAALSKARGEK